MQERLVEATYIEAESDAVEVPLIGGDVTDGIVRVGATVRRVLGPQSAAVHAYLEYLHRAGFHAAPRFLGIDEHGREVLTYIEGEMAGRPLHPWAADEELLVALARLQRRLHDCSVGFVLPDGIEWRAPIEIEGVLPPYDAADVVGHNDLTPENIIFVERKPVGIIDFDFAGPTTRILDVVTTLLWWAPLRDPVDCDPLFSNLDAGRRMRLFVDAYELDDTNRRKLLDAVERRQARSWHVMGYRAEHEGGGWARMWNEGVGDAIRRQQVWLRENRKALESALFD